MNVLLVAATRFEIEPFLSQDTNAEILITGVGIPATIFHLTEHLIKSHYDLVIQAGIAGTFDEQIEKGNVVLIERDAFGDLGIYERGSFTTFFENKFAGKNDFPFKDGWLINEHPVLSISLLPVVSAITVNTVSDSISRNNEAVEKFNAGIETMEGAALHYVCLQQKQPFLQIRSISNIVGERDKSKWEIKAAVTNLNFELGRLIKNFR